MMTDQPHRNHTHYTKTIHSSWRLNTRTSSEKTKPLTSNTRASNTGTSNTGTSNTRASNTGTSNTRTSQKPVDVSQTNPQVCYYWLYY